MNAEEILKSIKKHLSDVSENFEGREPDFEIYITPTTGDPTKPQDKVSLIIFEKVKDGIVPKFQITVENFLKK